jgi:hypothetical protein
MKKFLTNKIVIICTSIVVLIVGMLAAAYCGDMYGLRNLDFREVTTTQLAMAMRQDEFWSTYRENTLLFNGTVASVNVQGGHTVVSLKTTDTYGVRCEMAKENPNLKVGNTIKFEAETYQAERQPSGVLLHKCINP